jgi:hypothetical protein
MANTTLLELQLTSDVSLRAVHSGTGQATDAIGFRVDTAGREIMIASDTALALLAMVQAKRGEQLKL